MDAIGLARVLFSDSSSFNAWSHITEDCFRLKIYPLSRTSDENRNKEAIIALHRENNCRPIGCNEKKMI